MMTEPTAMKAQIEQTVRRLVSEWATEPPDLSRVTLETDLERDLDVDDLTAIEIVLALEEAFEVDIDDEEFFESDGGCVRLRPAVRTPGGIALFIAQKLGLAT